MCRLLLIWGLFNVKCKLLRRQWYKSALIQYLICLSNPYIYEDTAKIVMAQRWLKGGERILDYKKHFIAIMYNEIFAWKPMKYAHIWC